MRRAGSPVADIAAASSTSAARVLAATRSAGPFYRRGPTLPNGVVGVAGIARMCQVPTPTVLRWRRNGRLPAPDWTTAAHRPVWLTSTIELWLTTGGLATCPTCGAHVLSLPRHIGVMHRPC